MDFEFWQQWGRELNDADFARAWAALGVAAGSQVKRSSSEGYIGLLERNPTAPTAETYLEIAGSALTDALSASRGRERHVRWSFPTAAATGTPTAAFRCRASTRLCGRVPGPTSRRWSTCDRDCAWRTRLDEILDFLAEPALSEPDRQALGRIHRAFHGWRVPV